MMILRSLIVAIAVVVLAANPIPSGATEAGADDEDRYDVAQAVRVRTNFHLDASLATVQEAAVNISRYPDMSWGVPLSADEAAEMQRRIRQYEATLPLVREARNDPSWAGWWLDHSDGGRPVLLFAADPSTKRAEYGHLLPRVSEVRIENAALTLAELERGRATILAADGELAGEGIVLTGVGIDMSGNQLKVEVERASPAAHAAIAARFHGRFVVREEPAARADACPETGCLPLKGGIGITDQRTGDIQSACTIGYLARRTDVNPDKLVGVTAGHCIVSAEGHGRWRHGSQDIGNSASKGGIPFIPGSTTTTPTLAFSTLASFLRSQAIEISYWLMSLPSWSTTSARRALMPIK